MIDRPLLAAVAAVVREGSFERAARSLSVTPSAVSQRVRLLEERLGTVLVVRGQPCSATDAGARICRHAEAVGMLEAELARDLPGTATTGTGGGTPARRPVLRIAVNADSLATWFVDALRRFGERDDALVEVLPDDQDHTAEWLRRGHVLAAVTSSAVAVQGCRVRRLGALRYLATASPAFVQRWFEHGVTAESLSRAPSLAFDRKDRLQAAWVRRLLRRDLQLPAHALPGTHAFVEAACAGVGWGLNPEPLVRMHVRTGDLVELVVGRPHDVPLYWQCNRLPVELPMLDRLTAAVTAAASAALS